MKKLLCALLTLALLALPAYTLPAGAGSAADASVILSDLLPDGLSPLTMTDCDVRFREDGAMVVKVTGASPALTLTLAEGNILYVGSSVDLGSPAYFALDYGTAGSVVIPRLIFHYTRKDKAAAGGVADLWLESMYGADYASYRRQSDGAYISSSTSYGNGDVHYVVWDWGKYLTDSASKNLFDDKQHHFTSVELNLQGSSVGSELTFFTMAVVSDPNVKLGQRTPDPVEPPKPEGIHQEGDFRFEISKGQAAVVGCTDPGPQVTVPAFLGGAPVTEIRGNAFSDCNGVTAVVLPDTLESIAQEAFAGCASLTEILLPENLRSIGISAFAGCDGLTAVRIPAATSYIGAGAFGASGIAELTADGENPYFYAEGNCLIERDTGILIQGCSASVIPQGIKAIGRFAFSGVGGLREIALPEGLESIGEQAFSGSGLQSIRIPASVTAMGDDVFLRCGELTRILCDSPARPEGWKEGWLGDCPAFVLWGGQTVLPGDLNENGKIDATDYLLLKRYCLGSFALTDAQKAASDVNGDGKINSVDYLLVKRHVLGTFKIG